MKTVGWAQFASSSLCALGEFLHVLDFTMCWTYSPSALNLRETRQRVKHLQSHCGHFAGRSRVRCRIMFRKCHCEMIHNDSQLSCGCPLSPHPPTVSLVFLSHLSRLQAARGILESGKLNEKSNRSSSMLPASCFLQPTDERIGSLSVATKPLNNISQSATWGGKRRSLAGAPAAARLPSVPLVHA